MAHRKLKLVALCTGALTALLAASSALAWTVDLTAEPSLKRTHSWKIEKSASTSSLTLKKGESATVSYSVTVGPAAAPVDSDWSVSGTMEMTDDPNITVNSVEFNIIPLATTSPAILASHACMPMTFPVDLGIVGLECTYSSALPDASDRRAWMRATATEDDGTTGARSVLAPFSFSTATVNEVDECVDVTDSIAGALGTVCAADAPKTFTYSTTVGPFGECGSKTVDNTATYTGKDSGTTGSSSASVDVKVVCEPPKNGCVHTIGYWKNHAGFGPQADVVSPLLPLWLGTAGGAKSINVATAAQAVSLLKMEGSNGVASASNGINKLYAQLLAAKLNGASNADLSSVAGVISTSDAFLADNDSLSWSGLSMLQQAAVVLWMAKLDLYNNGKFGADHCDDGDECKDRDGKYSKGYGGSHGDDECDDDEDECKDRDGKDGKSGGSDDSKSKGYGGYGGHGGGDCDDDDDHDGHGGYGGHDGDKDDKDKKYSKSGDGRY